MASRDKDTHPVGATLVATAPESRASTLPQNDRRTAWLLGLGVFMVFALMATAWVFLFKAAREAQVESVPLAPKGAKP